MRSLTLTSTVRTRDLYIRLKRAFYANHAGLDRKWWVNSPMPNRIEGTIRYSAQYPITLFGRGYRRVQTEITMVITLSPHGTGSRVQVEYSWQTSFPINVFRGGMDHPGWAYLDRTTALIQRLCV